MSIVLVALITYVCLSIFYRHRTAVAVFGAGIIVLLGQHEGFYPASIALQRIPIEVLIVILVLSLFTKEFENLGILAFLGPRAASIARGRQYVVMVILLLSTFTFSLFANNLAVTLVFTTVCLRLGIALQLPIVPLIAATVISCNIGGCPLPWADTPAIILTIYTDFDIVDFLNFLFPVCAVFALTLIGYTLVRTKTRSRSLSRSDELLNLECIKFISKFERVRWKDAVPPGILFLFLLMGVSLAPFLGVPIWFAAIPPGALLLLFKGKEAKELLDIPGLMDTILFISALFLIAGGVETSGVLSVLVVYIKNLHSVSVILPSICVLLTAFALSTFLSAGPAAATLLPICLEVSAFVGKTTYAALALGILAGSSMLPWSATGGSVMLNQVARYLKQERIDDNDKNNVEKLFRLHPYVRFSVPFSMIMLTLSVSWLCYLVLVRGYG